MASVKDFRTSYIFLLFFFLLLFQCKNNSELTGNVSGSNSDVQGQISTLQTKLEDLQRRNASPQEIALVKMQLAELENIRRLPDVILAPQVRAKDKVCAQVALKDFSLSLADEDRSALIDASRSLVASKKTELRVENDINIVPDSSSYYLSNHVEQIEYFFAYKGVKLCQYHFKSFNVTTNSPAQPFLGSGLWPSDLRAESLKKVSEGSWGDFHLSLEAAIKALGISVSTSEMQTITQELESLALDHPIYGLEKCLAFDGSQVVPAWEIYFSLPDKENAHNWLPYYALASGENVLRVEEKFLHGSGVGNAYKKTILNRVANLQLTQINIEDIATGGSLCNAKFSTLIPDNMPQAYSQGLQFLYEPEDPRFKETSLFINANTMSNWFLTLPAMKDWLGPQIQIKIDGTNSGINNTATYIPGKGGFPQIFLGQGDSINLKQLQIDPDVISHELSHHLVYRTLKTTTSGSDSVVLHEGIADFFVFAHTGDSCLGELICPKGGKVCKTEQCLRNGNNTMKLNDPDLPYEAHKKGQMISGILWNLSYDVDGKNPEQANEPPSQEGLIKVANLMVQAIDFLDKEAGYESFFQSLLMADKIANKGLYECKIRDEAMKRFFNEYLPPSKNCVEAH